jgi:hypothetical protein
VLQCSPYNVATPFHPVRYYLERAAELRSSDESGEALGKVARRELELRLNLTGPLVAARGYGESHVADEVAQTAALAQRLGNKARLIPALASQWVTQTGVGNTVASHGLARQIRDTAADGTDIDRLIAYRILGTTLLFEGEFEAALSQMTKFLDLFDEELHGDALAKVGPSSHALMAVMGIAEIHTICGRREDAAAWVARCLTDARRLGQAHNVCHAIPFAGCLLPAITGDVAALIEHSSELKKLTTVHGLPF